MVALYFVTNFFIRDETDEGLESTLYRIEQALEKDQNINSLEPLITVQNTEELGKTVLKDTLIFDPAQNEEELFREISSYKKVHNKNYKISVRTLVVESDDIILAILIAYLSIIFLVFLTQFYYNRINSKIIWKPFFKNIKKIQQFSLQSDQEIVLEDTDILEFSELNNEIKSLTTKVVTDYRNLKQFTEDVSHEIQTPLAIAQAKVGNLIDEDGISDKQFQLLTEVQQNIQRLANLNKRLVLLTKIENQQFDYNQKINITESLKSSISNLKEISDIPIESNGLKDLNILLDENLAGILTDNLLSNAIKYTPKTGKIFIRTDKKSFTVSNSGKDAIKEPHKLYNRFYTENKSKKSLGLGLAIVKKICDEYDFNIEYSFKDQHHNFTIHFPAA